MKMKIFVGILAFIIAIGFNIIPVSGDTLPTTNCVGEHMVDNCIEPPFEPYIKYVFEDVWDEDAWYFEPIYGVAEIGIMQGYDNGYFGYEDDITWLQTVILSTRINDYVRGRTFVQKSSGANWYQPFIDYALENEIIKSIPKNVNEPITRGNAAKILVKVIPQEKISADAELRVFEDIDSADTEMVNAVNNLQNAGVVNGKTDTLFGTNDTLTRAEMAAMLYRML